MKLSTFIGIALLLVLATLGVLAVKNPKSFYIRTCEERLLPKADILGGSCQPPSKLMKVGDQWMCSCRTEVDTMKGIKP